MKLTFPPDNEQDYIHANYVNCGEKGKFICTQGPTELTTPDFWRMVIIKERIEREGYAERKSHKKENGTKSKREQCEIHVLFPRFGKRKSALL